MEPAALHILIVDDSPEDRFTLRRLLTHATPGTYTITEADRGDRALAACQAFWPDCILLDYRLPGTDGLAVLAAIRAQRDVPVVLLTGVGSEALAVTALQQGAQDYLVKEALTPERLSLTIQHAITAVRLTRERDQTLALLTTMLDVLPVGVVVLDADQCVRQANPALATIVGQPATALPEQALAQLWPDLAAVLAAPCAQVLGGVPFGDQEVHLPATAAHAERWLALSGTPLRATDASPLILLTAQDVTARHQAEAARRASEARFRALIELGTEGLALIEADGQLRYGSPGLTTLLGCAPETVPTLGLRDLCHPDDQPQLTAFLAALSAQAGATAQVTTRLRHQGGTWRWIALRGCDQTDFPALAARIVSFHDVTAWVQVEQAAQAAARRLQILADVANALATTVTDERAILEVVAQRTADALGAGCLIWLRVDEAPWLHPAMIAAPDPAVQTAIQAMVGSAPLALDAATPTATVARTGQPLLIASVDSEAIRATVAPERWPAVAHVRPQSQILAPLRVRGQILGCLAFTRYGEGQPAFTLDDLTLAQELADGVALAITNARLYQHAQVAEQTATETLARLDALIRSVPSGIGYLDRELRYQLVNPALAAINHRTPEEHLGCTPQEVLPGLAPRLEPIMRQVLETGAAVRDLELHGQFCATIGGPHDWLISYFPIHGPAGAVTGVGVTVTDVTVSKGTAAALRDTERKLGTLFELLPVGVSIFDHAGNLAYVNPALERILRMDRAGLFAEAHLARPYFRPDGSSRPLDELVRHRVLREHAVIENQANGFLTEAGEEIWINVSGARVDFPDWRAVLITTDITAQRAAQQALEAERQQLATTLNTMQEGLIAARPDGTLALLNPAALQLGDLDPGAPPARVADLISTPRLFLDADGQPVVPDDLPLQRVLRGERLVGLEQCQRSIRDGTERWHLINGTPAYDAEGRLQLGVITFQDITDRKRAEAQLRQHEAALAAAYAQVEEHAAQLTSLIAHAPVGISLLDPELRFQHMNASLAAMNGLSPEAHLGRRLREVLPALAPVLEPIYHQVLATGAPLLDQEIRGESPGASGQQRIWRASYFPVRAATDAILGVGVVVIDVTTQRQAEQALAAHAETLSRINAELTRALRLKDEFLAMISHELRTPLTVILGYSEGLAEEVYGPLAERQRNALAQVTASGQHLLGVLTDILDLTALEGGRAALDPARVMIDDLCRAATQLVTAKAQRKQIQLTRTVAVGIEALRADERRLTQILVNLLDNAIKFTPAGGQVGLEVTANAAREQIAFTVWDNGIGIAEADYPRLFQPFTQIDARLARDYEGIGLGLSLVRRLVKLHGGSIQLVSQPGQGSRFTVSLPWAADDNVALPSLPRPAPPPQRWATPPRLVIADDHEETLIFYRERLTQAGCTLAVARTGAEALAQVRATRPDVAILDIQMPELDGLTAIRQIRADAELGATPIIALTALAMPGDRERCLEAGANVYLAKPVSVHALLAAITAVLPTADALPAEGAGEGAP